MHLEQSILINLILSQVQVEYIKKTGQQISNGIPEKSVIEKLINVALSKNREYYDYKRIDFYRFLVIRKIGRMKTNDPKIIDDKHYKPWLNDNAIPFDKKRKNIDWRFWEDYKQYLIDDIGRSENDITRVLDRETTQLLNRLMDPETDGRWSRKGMVVGNVQSGKTGNYTGLISKAVDVGYKMIIVLAGLHNSLRSQTQQRLDKEFIGFDTNIDDNENRISRIGVGNKQHHLNNAAIVYWNTYSDPKKGDFKKENAYTGIQINRSMTPTIFIVKKNKYILENVLVWLSTRGLEEGQEKIDDIPFLLIDDECDNASINTKPFLDNKGRKNDPSTINYLIRKILHSFGQSGYVGYTATPYANMLIPRDKKDKEIAQDLFPSNFIVHLQTPSNYLGPKHIFGLEELKEVEQDKFDGFPVVNNELDFDYYDFIPDGHKIDYIVPDTLPESLKKAIKCFILSCAARSYRNQQQHRTMLIHVTRFVNVQKKVAIYVDEYLISLRSKIINGDQKIFQEFKELWEDDFIYSSTEMSKIGYGEVHAFEKIQPHIINVIQDIGEPLLINGEAGDTLEYIEADKNGVVLTIIAIGGDKLSRGLTLEGLTVSYYLRASRMYDTLLQMGRWFGYKDGYQDLCRIFTTSRLTLWYSHIASVNLELENEFNNMVKNTKLEPKDYGLKIRSHHGLEEVCQMRMQVTSATKRRSGSSKRISFGGNLVQLSYVEINSAVSKHNLSVLDKLCNDKEISTITRLNENGKESKVGSGIYKGENNYQDVINILKSFDTLQNNLGNSVADYISSMVDIYKELMNWTILLVSPPGNKSIKDNNLNNFSVIRPVKRNESDKIKGNISVNWQNNNIRISKSLVSKTDLICDLNKDELESINYSPYKSREARSEKNGLLLIYPIVGKTTQGKTYGDDYPLIGYAVDIPTSENDKKIEYIIDEVMAKDFIY